jgi:hypothetical protein
MTWLTDDLLSAYIDGELDAAEAARVALALTRDREAVRRLNELRKTDALLHEAFDWPLPDQAALTEHLAAQMDQPSWLSRWAPRLGLATAGALAVAVLGFGLGRFGAPRDVRIDPVLGTVAGGQLAQALETQASDETGALRIAMTFRAKDGRVCRQFASGASLEGLACRDAGQWLLPALATSVTAPVGDRAQAGGDPVDRAVQAVGVAEVIELSQEAALIRSGWR